MNNKELLIEEYENKFGDEPPLLMCTSYSHPIYQKLMKKAIKDNKPITTKDIDEAFKNVKYDHGI